jgi:hypothetical protein
MSKSVAAWEHSIHFKLAFEPTTVSPQKKKPTQSTRMVKKPANEKGSRGSRQRWEARWIEGAEYFFLIKMVIAPSA